MITLFPTRISQQIRHFARDEKGSIIVEAVMVLPFLFWSYMALFVYWDNYRSINTSQKAAYTLSDMISREMQPVNANYIAGMASLMEFLIDPEQTAKIRVTSIKWSAVNNRYEVLWSNSPGSAMPALTNTSLAQFNDCSNMATAGHKCRIPMMSDGDTAVIVETEINYTPPFNVPFYTSTVSGQVMKQFVVTRPRFVPRVCFTGITCT